MKLSELKPITKPKLIKKIKPSQQQTSKTKTVTMIHTKKPKKLKKTSKPKKNILPK
jgi:hypothetical protein